LWKVKVRIRTAQEYHDAAMEIDQSMGEAIVFIEPEEGGDVFESTSLATSFTAPTAKEMDIRSPSSAESKNQNSD
jgi:hypothetical protein